MYLSKFTFSLPYEILSFILELNKNGSCVTMAIFSLKLLILISLISISPILILPSSGS